MSGASALIPAATVILLRPGELRGFEVLLIRRPAAMRFLGGMYCFPGGALCAEDWSNPLLRRARGLTPARARAIVGADFAPGKALAFWLGAIRELFEETGVLLASRPDGKPPTAAQAELDRMHGALAAGALAFRELLEREDLVCDAQRLHYFAHWQTPPDVATRFDTRFFVATLPHNQTPLGKSAEVADSLWLTPDHALQLFARDQVPMIFPTFAALRTLADFDDLDSVIREYSHSELRGLRHDE